MQIQSLEHIGARITDTIPSSTTRVLTDASLMIANTGLSATYVPDAQKQAIFQNLVLS
jgi:hypothetical protein